FWLYKVDIRQPGLGRGGDCIDHPVEYTVTPLPTDLLDPCMRCCSSIGACGCLNSRSLRFRSGCASWYLRGNGTCPRASVDHRFRVAAIDRSRSTGHALSDRWVSVVGSC